MLDGIKIKMTCQTKNRAALISYLNFNHPTA